MSFLQKQALHNVNISVYNRYLINYMEVNDYVTCSKSTKMPLLPIDFKRPRLYSCTPLPHLSHLIKPTAAKFLPRNASKSCKLERSNLIEHKLSLLPKFRRKIPRNLNILCSYSSAGASMPNEQPHAGRNSVIKRNSTANKENISCTVNTIEQTKSRMNHLEKVVNVMLKQSKLKTIQS
jgi:hypothetical protein